MAELTVSLQVLASTLAGTFQLAPAPMTSTVPRLASESKLLINGDNTFTAPTAGAAFCVIIFSSSNPGTYKLKSDPADVGLGINKVGSSPFLMIPTSSDVIINVSGGDDLDPTEIYWF